MVIAVTHPVVAQGVAEVPDFRDEGAAVHFGGSVWAATWIGLLV